MDFLRTSKVNQKVSSQIVTVILHSSLSIIPSVYHQPIGSCILAELIRFHSNMVRVLKKRTRIEKINNNNNNSSCELEIQIEKEL